jgi:ribosome biogenesis protein Nip4
MKVYTLANLVKPNIIKTLKSREKIKAFSLKERQSYTLSEEKVGNDAIINKPNPNSVFDFIKNGSKKEEK